MVNCEMCGTDTNLMNVSIEGAELNVCSKCSSYGKVVKKTFKKSQIRNFVPPRPQKEIAQLIVSNYSKIIREKREKMGLKQKELAKFLAERESLIHKMESNDFAPSIELARKLEKQLGITLVEEREFEPQNIKASKQEYTIGDMIKIK